MSSEDENKSVVREVPEETTASETSGETISGVEQNKAAGTSTTVPDDNADARERDAAVMGYDQQMQVLREAAEASRPENEQERQKRERRERSRKVISAVTDGLSALSNLFFTTRYAPNSYDPAQSQMSRTMARLKEQKEERKADADHYYNLMLRLGDAQNAKAQTLSALKARQEAQKLARAKAERDAELHPLLMGLKQAQTRKEDNLANKAGYDAEASRLEADNKPTELELKNKGLEADIRQKEASAANSYASARSHDRNNPNEFSAWDERGNEHKFRTKEAAIAFAKQHGTYKEEEVKEETNSELEGITTKTTKSGYPARPEKKESPTAGGGEKKKSPTS